MKQVEDVEVEGGQVVKLSSILDVIFVVKGKGKTRSKSLPPFFSVVF